MNKDQSRKKDSWVKRRGLPIHIKKMSSTQKVMVVYLNEFWEWAERNRTFINFSKLEPLALGKEPAWVAQQRRIDMVSYGEQWHAPWTQYEDQRLICLVKQQKYTYVELSQELGRSVSAISFRCSKLGLQDRPVEKDAHNPWTDAELQRMADMIRQGYSYAMIGEACGGRSVFSVRTIIYGKYHTSNADKVRAMLGDGPWGSGAPEPTVKSEKRTAAVKKQISRLCGLLLLRRHSMEEGMEAVSK